MQTPIFDSHAHYLSHQFDADRTETLQHLLAADVVGIVECGTDFATSSAALALCDAHPGMVAALGIHPESLIEEDSSTVARFHGDWQAELAAIEPLFRHAKAVAVGECGLDYHWPVPKAAQLEMFEAHLQLAKRLNKPIVVHDREAHADVYALLKQYKPKGVMHSFSGSAEDAAWLCAQGMYIGFGGALTFKGAKRAAKAAASVPLQRIVLETDCPYSAPVPCRGQRCDSGMIAHVAAFLAALRGISTAEVCARTAQNAKDLFEI